MSISSTNIAAVLAGTVMAEGLLGMVLQPSFRARGEIDVKRGKQMRRTRRDVASLTNSQKLEPFIHIWLAGLGAISKARSEGPKLLQELIKEGARVESHQRNVVAKAAHGTFGEVPALVRRLVDELPPVRVLREVRALRKQVDAMRADIEKLARGRRAPRKRRMPQAPRSTD
jgi:Poly(hydroxyalcanoate) granule associated protein (phasin)